MRNLKRALSLALASVMVMGLAVVGSNASYVDVTSKQNQEAIEVLQKVGIMVGDENGKFNPEAKVTRNEMAVIMANLMDYRVASYKGTSPFTDVPDWAEPYVAACYTNGIISGYSAKTFGGSDPVSTSQAALMLMKALGYFQYQSDFENDWQLATVKQGNKIDLFDDVDSNVRESMTRNDVAQLVLNALKSGTVEAVKNGQDVSANGVTITSSVNYNYITSSKDYAKAVKKVKTGTGAVSSNTEGYIVELGEKLYNGDLKMVETTDDFKAPATRWTYKSAEVGTYADSADYAFSGIVKSNAMYDAVSKTVADNYTWSIYTDGVAGYKLDEKTGKNTKTGKHLQDAVKENNKSDLDATVRGSNTYVYLDDDKDTATVVVENIYIAEITKVKDDTITLDDETEGAIDFDVDGYKEGDMVLYTKVGDDVQAILGKAELKEGTIETVRNEDRIVIDGTTYKYSAKFNESIDGGKLDTSYVDQKVSFYLDGQGNIIAFEDSHANNDYAYVYSIGQSSSQYNKDDNDYGAKLILSDGTVKSVILDSDDTDPYTKSTKDQATAVKNLETQYLNKVVDYSQNDDGTYSITVRSQDTYTVDFKGDVSDVTKNGSARVLKATSSTNFYADKDTVFLVNEGDDDDDFDAYVGYENVPNVDASNGSKLVAYVNKDGVAKVVVLTNITSNGSSDDVIFVVGNTTAKANKSGSTTYYVYDAVVNGEVTTIKVKDGSDAYTYAKQIKDDTIGVFFGQTKNSSGYTTKLDTKTPKDVEVNGKTTAKDTFVDYSAREYEGVKRESSGGNLTFDTNTKTPLSIAANSKALIVYYDGDALSIETRLVTDKNDKATVVTDDGDIIAICVRDFDGGKLANG